MTSQFFDIFRIFFLDYTWNVKIIESPLRTGQYKDDDYREDAPHFTWWTLINVILALDKKTIEL